MSAGVEHYCPDWDFARVRPGDPEMEVCTCSSMTDLGGEVWASTDGFSVTLTSLKLSPRQLHALIAYARGLGLLEG